MKKFFALALTLVMALSLVACSVEKTNEPAKDSAPAQTETKTEALGKALRITMKAPYSWALFKLKA